MTLGLSPFPFLFFLKFTMDIKIDVRRTVGDKRASQNIQGETEQGGRTTRTVLCCNSFVAMVHGPVPVAQENDLTESAHQYGVAVYVLSSSSSSRGIHGPTTRLHVSQPISNLVRYLIITTKSRLYGPMT